MLSGSCFLRPLNLILSRNGWTEKTDHLRRFSYSLFANMFDQAPIVHAYAIGVFFDVYNSKNPRMELRGLWFGLKPSVSKKHLTHKGKKVLAIKKSLSHICPMNNTSGKEIRLRNVDTDVYDFHKSGNKSISSELKYLLSASKKKKISLRKISALIESGGVK